MNTEFRRAIVPTETRSLVIFAHKAFHEYSGLVEGDDWKTYKSWWMIVNNS